MRHSITGKILLAVGVLLIAAARWFQCLGCHCPVCGHFNGRDSLTNHMDFSCKFCGVTHYDM